MKSIFENFKPDITLCTSAVKNISRLGVDKSTMVTLKFKGLGGEKDNVVIGASFMTDKQGKFKLGEPVKAFLKFLQNPGDERQYIKIEHRCFSSEIPVVVYDDLAFIDQLFEDAEDEVKRIL